MDARNKKEFLTSEEIASNVIVFRKKENLPMKGIASSNIRRQIKRLKDIFIVENITNQYRITEFDTLDNIFKNKIEKLYMENIVERVKEYLGSVK